LFDQTRPINAGSTVPIKVKIADVNGANQSSQAIVLTALRVEPGNIAAIAPGSSSPTNLFRFDPTTQSYHFNLQSERTWTAGTYQLIFRIAGDPVERSISFIIR
jgi:hypothetical protein